MMLQEKIRRNDRSRAEPTGDFSQYLPPNDPIRLELESLFPPFVASKRHRASQGTAA
jgi:hypothetical protein